MDSYIIIAHFLGFLGYLLIHWLCDFVLQTHWQATNKSTNLVALLYHVLNYSFTMIFIIVLLDFPYHWIDSVPYIIGKIVNVFLFIFISHFLTDYFTSKISSKFFKEEDFHNGFVVVGADQWIHTFQLMLVYLYMNL